MKKCNLTIAHSRTSKGVEILAREGGEKVALYTDNALKEIKYIDEGGEILGSTGKIKIFEQDGNKVESVLQIIKKDGQIGFRKTITHALDDVWQLAKQKLGKSANSTVLGDNLVAVGKVRPANNAAHHIVAGTHEKAEAARRILQKEGIDINEAANGVFLPKSSKYVIDDAVAHSKVPQLSRGCKKQ